ncbi:MAG TPA: ferredoxin--NADP reductase [Candidatus Sulfomarinibacteraceae bacterium]|nr:ferredoxin--NADP reductase [Candidatus Sulfomarinibacteraceae bacterium]
MPTPELNAVVTQKIEVAPGLMVIRVVPDGWELPDFVPGQFAVLGLPPEAGRSRLADTEEAPTRPGRLIRRAYSIASSSRARRYLEFYITLVQSGALSPRLFNLRPGDRVWLGPKITGTFTLDHAPPDNDLVLIATGTGLAPYMSMLRTELATEPRRRFAVLLGARHSWDLGYHSELVTMEQLSPPFSYLPIISRPAEEPVPWTGRAGYVLDLWRSRELDRVWGRRPHPADTSIFLCGNPHMIDDMVELLSQEGFTEHSRERPGSIFVERYW